MKLPPIPFRDRLRYAWYILRAHQFIVATKRPGKDGRIYFRACRDFTIDTMQELCDYWNAEAVGESLAKLTQEEDEE